MITTLSIISLDQGKIWRAPRDEDEGAENPAQAVTRPARARRQGWGWIWVWLPVRQRAA
jgi:hypothetical protein